MWKDLQRDSLTVCLFSFSCQAALNLVDQITPSSPLLCRDIFAR
jgi:hypothetical protein